MSRKLKIFFHMIDAVGPQNACIGLGQVLLARGHQVFFLTKTDNRVQGKISKYGFTVIPIKGSDEDTGEMTEEQALAEQKEEIEWFIKLGIFENIPPAQKLKLMFNEEFMEMYMPIYERYEVQIRALIEKEKPDLIVVDAIAITPPALLHSGIPWVQLYCSNPLGVFHSDQLPPATSGFPTNGDRSQWEEYRKVYKECHNDLMGKYQRKLLEKFNYPIPNNPDNNILSPYLNIYQFPEELDYHDVIAIPKNYLRVDAFCREEPGEFQLPAEFKNKMKPGDKLIYFSLGSIGTSYLKLMRRIIAILAKTKHFYIVSKGLYHDELELAENMYGDRYLPQTQILQQVDLAIIHGGNNSLTEAIYHGVPVIVLALFYDQTDNAQRCKEKNFGISIDPFNFEDQELIDAIEKVLADDEMKDRFVKASQRIRASNTKLKAAIEMEKVAEKFGQK